MTDTGEIVTQQDREARIKAFNDLVAMTQEQRLALGLTTDDTYGEGAGLLAIARARTESTTVQVGVVGELVKHQFWLSLREPGCIPERKGPWPVSQTAKVLREFIAARPTAYIDCITLDCFGHPQIEHGPEVLQIIDGRSMSTGRKHNQRVRKAADALLSLQVENERLRQGLKPFASAAAGVEAFDPDFPMDGAALRPSFDWYDKAQDEPLKRHSVQRSDLETAHSLLGEVGG